MKEKKNFTPIKIITMSSFLIMILVNALANILPINGVGTGQVSDSYKNLFAPAAITFSIWGVIYFLLAGYTLYQNGFFINKTKDRAELLKKVGIYFSVSSLVNAAWIFAWHYYLIGLSMIFMIIILICLIIINNEIKKEDLSLKEKIFIRLPFSVYFGWITVATIANATALLVGLGWNGFGVSQQIWTVVVIIVGFVIGTATMLRNNDIAYGLVIVWAYLGILIKHLSTNGFAGRYSEVIISTGVCIVLIIIVQVYLFVSGRKKSLS